MAKFRITKPYTMPREEVREAAEGLAASLERQHGVRSRWEGNSVRIKGAGVDGIMSFHDGLIDVSVRMGILASMFEPVLKEEVQRYLDTHVT
ncbi:MAG TPA: polyhydroxyalkanoic acid synthase [Halieaceae bacterium]|nr:MAG: polyhydroxyalkanoic acid synthase [Gammaproteobacteria bacterium]HDY82532.1 polyhydroxyalkanoic acid synthase [Halieaceae bacterium]